MIDWNMLRFFNTGENWSESPDLYAEPRLLLSLESYRVNYNAPIIPSPAPGALARFGGSKTSRHYVGDIDNLKRRSTAIDVFPQGDIRRAFTMAIADRNFGGVGIYFDTHLDGKPAPMLHLDLRANPTFWFRVSGEYYYPNKSPSALKKLFAILQEY